MRMLVTGDAGFIGSRCVARFVAEGHQVWVLDNLSSGSKATIHEWFAANRPVQA